MKKAFLLAFIGALLLSVCLVSPSCGVVGSKGPDTLRINTADLGADLMGYNGPTPVEIVVYKGVITEINALPNQETPRFMKRVLDTGLLKSLDGKTLEEAAQTQLDTVTGATFTSETLIENIRLGLEKAQELSRTKK